MNNGGFIANDCKHLFCTMQKVNYFVILKAVRNPSSFIFFTTYGYQI